MHRYLWAALLAAAALGVVTLGLVGAAGARGGSGYEVWAVDQSNTNGTTSGGTIHVYDGRSLEGRDASAARPERIDLTAAVALCVAQTGTAPVRPHMLFFNTAESHGVLAFVASGHVLFLDADERTPLACIDVGVQAHAAVPSPDESYVVVANQNGKLLQRIKTDYATNTFTLEPGATLDLANGTTPTGAPRQDPVLRPDNAPICPLIDSTSRLTFVTLRGGGLFVVDSLATPMRIVAEYDQRDDPRQRLRRDRDGREDVPRLGRRHGNEHGRVRRLRVHAGGLPTCPQAALCTFAQPNTPAAKLVVSQDDRSTPMRTASR